MDLRKVNRRVVESLIKSGAFDGFTGDRAQNLATLDITMERGQKIQKDRANGQISMFDSQMGIENTEPLPQVQTWSEQQRLAYEKESLGFYITGHPLDKHRKELERYATVDLGRLGELSDGQDVKVAGIKQSVKEINTKKGDRMAFLTLEDLHGSVELIIFADIFKEAAGKISSDDPIFVEGTVDSNGDKPKVIVHKLDLLENYRQKVTSVVQINLTTLGLTKEDLVLLKSILQKYEGECRVKLRLTIPTKAEAVIWAEESLQVGASDEMVQEVENRFGSGTVTFE